MLRYLPLLLVCAIGADWPHWRGASRNGVTTEKSGWTEGAWIPEKPTWKKQLGAGASSPVVVGEQLFMIGYANGEDTLHCLEATTGQERWSVSYTCKIQGRFREGDLGLYSGPSSTPEYDPETKFLYTLSTDGHLNCWNTAERGKVVWSKNLYDEYQVGKRPKLTKAPLRDYGYTSSPLVVGKWLIVEVGSTAKGSVIAFDKLTGKQVWASELKDEAGHTGGMTPMTIENVPCLAVITQRNLAAIRLDAGNEGKTVATFPWVTDFANTIASPAVHGDSVLVTAAYNQNAMCKVRFTLNTATEVWRKKYPSKVCTPVIHEGRIYVTWQKARCLSWETGEQIWEGGVFGDAGSCILTADKRLIVYGGTSKLALLDPSGTTYRELFVRDRIHSAIAWPHVVLSGGRLFCRDREGSLAMFELPK